jgi:hypothetical protein
VTQATWLGALLLIGSIVSACSRGPRVDPDLQGEASLLLQSVERLRQAPNAAKRTELTRLREAPCTHAETCALKDRCADAYQRFVAALDGITHIESALQTNAAFRANDLTKAQQSLDSAREKTLACANAQGELARLVGH